GVYVEPPVEAKFEPRLERVLAPGPCQAGLRRVGVVRAQALGAACSKGLVALEVHLREVVWTVVLRHQRVGKPEEPRIEVLPERAAAVVPLQRPDARVEDRPRVQRAGPVGGAARVAADERLVPARLGRVRAPDRAAVLVQDVVTVPDVHVIFRTHGPVEAPGAGIEVLDPARRVYVVIGVVRAVAGRVRKRVVLRADDPG